MNGSVSDLFIVKFVIVNFDLIGKHFSQVELLTLPLIRLPDLRFQMCNQLMR